MELITANKLTYHAGSRLIIDRAGFRLLDERRYGLVGPNGAGKTTLIRLLLGEIETERKTITRKPGLRIGYVPQSDGGGESETIREHLLAPCLAVRERMTALEERMAEAPAGESAGLLSAYQALLDEYEAAGGYEAEERIDGLLESLGMDNDPDQLMASLSGGERSLVLFTRALLARPELLVLDEPGNHLDFLGLAWLESFLSSWTGAVLIVSHNRYLLDRVCTDIFELTDGILTACTGNYSAFRLQKMREAIVRQNEYLVNRKAIAELERKVKELRSITSSQYNPPAVIMSKLGAAKRKLAEEQEKNLERPVIDGQAIRLEGANRETRSRVALQVKNFTMGFPDRPLLEDVSLELLCGEKAALVGANGTGKTTLIRRIIEEASWDHDRLRIGPSLTVGYMSQVPVFSPQATTIEEEVRSWGPLTKDGAFGVISPLLFTWEDMEKPLSVLSGGEKNRLQLARLFYREANFLILDEPTNHLDIPSREVIEEALSNFTGTLLVVSHDRYFLDRIVGRIFEIENRRILTWEGNFSSYFRAKHPVLPRFSGSMRKRGRERERERTRSPVSAARIRQVEAWITEREKEKLELEARMNEAFRINDHVRGRSLAVKIEKCSAELEKHYAEWESLSD